jgi:spectinomycin phosphotransferase
VRSLPANLTPEAVRAALAEGWGLRAASMDYVPQGAGSYHWKLTAEDGRSYFVTVDDLDSKDWIGTIRDSVFDGLGRAFSTAAALRDEAGLEFVVAPIAARDGGFLRRLDDQYSLSVFRYLAGRSYGFGRYPDAQLRGQALDLVAALHRATPAVREGAPRHVLSFGGREDLNAFLRDKDRPWDGGPFAQYARELLVARAGDIARLADGFDRLAEQTAAARADLVITHGEPHPGNLMCVDGRLVLVDWDTAGLGPPERDLSLIAAGDEDIDRYQEAAGRELDPAVITLYRLRWYLDDLASATRLFRNSHQDTPDTRMWRDSLPPQLQQLSDWLAVLSDQQQ